MEVKAEYLKAFSEEASEMLEEWEHALLTLETSPDNEEPLNDMFRAIHTVKGSAGFIEFDELQRLAHDLESSLSKVRDGDWKYDERLGQLLFEGLDLSRTLIESFANGATGLGGGHEVDDFLARLKGLSDTPTASQGGPVAEVPPAPATHAAEPLAGPSSSDAPTRAGSLIARMTAIRERSSRQRTTQPQIATVADPQKTGTLVVSIEGQNREAYLRSCIVKARLERLGTVLSMEPSPDVLRDSKEPFVYRVTISASQDATALASSIAIDQVSVAAEVQQDEHPTEITAESPGFVPNNEKTPKAARSETFQDAKKAERPDEVVRVSVQKLDLLLNLVGELVVHNSGFVSVAQQLRQHYGRAPLVFDIEEKTEALSVVTRDLQDGIMKARMLPIASVFDRFRRVVRDLSRASGKSVSIEVVGEETEIDKKVLDRIGEPLVHLIRNAVDHGLEPDNEREAAGKNGTGTVRLSAYQAGDHICVEVSDDGRGLDKRAILAKAIAKGLITESEASNVNPDQVLGFIFLPGFSTADKVSDISGRGVGMDAVKRAVESMNGNIRVNSTPGAGTTVTISLPLTMAIVSAVLVESRGATFAIPMSAVREIVKASNSIARSIGKQPAILLRNEVLSLVSLARVLDQTAQPGTTNVDKDSRQVRPIVVVDFEGNKIGIEVDAILGSREVVIKSLSRHYREVAGLIGASILGNGKIALIVDVEAIVKDCRSTPSRPRTVGALASSKPILAGLGALDSPRSRQTKTPDHGSNGARGPKTASVDDASIQSAQQRIESLARDVNGAKGRLLNDANNQGAIQASMALSELTGEAISVSFPESRLVAINDIAEAMGGPEARVAGVYVGFQGDLTGAMLLVIPDNNLLVLDNLLHRRPAEADGELSEVDLSGISEIGNILASCFINAIADSAHLALGPEVPGISIDMCMSVIDPVLARFNEVGEKILLTDAVILAGTSNDIVCHQVLFLDSQSLQKLMGELDSPAVPAEV